MGTRENQRFHARIGTDDCWEMLEFPARKGTGACCEMLVSLAHTGSQ